LFCGFLRNTNENCRYNHHTLEALMTMVVLAVENTCDGDGQ